MYRLIFVGIVPALFLAACDETQLPPNNPLSVGNQFEYDCNGITPNKVLLNETEHLGYQLTYGGQEFDLTQVVAASGVKYQLPNGGYFWTHQDEALFNPTGNDASVTCTLLQ